MRYPETAQLIRSARLRKGLSQERAAATIGCSRLQFIRWEQGIHRPNPDGHGARLVDVLEIDRERLTAADDDEEAASMPPLTQDEYALLGVLMARLGTSLQQASA